jgi:hypothetical protein
VQLVWERANSRCEYCQFPAAAARLPFQIDHIISEQHGGPTSAENLTLSCERCNSHKGPNIAGFDWTSQQHVPLFNPRRERWSDHFEWNGAELIGKTPVGKVTVEVLAINLPYLVRLRIALIEEGMFPRAE